jgi:hypothetical protein
MESSLILSSTGTLARSGSISSKGNFGLEKGLERVTPNGRDVISSETCRKPFAVGVGTRNELLERGVVVVVGLADA